MSLICRSQTRKVTGFAKHFYNGKVLMKHLELKMKQKINQTENITCHFIDHILKNIMSFYRSYSALLKMPVRTSYQKSILLEA